MNWEVHKGIEFVLEVSAVGEPFQVNDKNLRQSPQIELLGRLMVFLAAWTIPSIDFT